MLSVRVSGRWHHEAAEIWSALAHGRAGFQRAGFQHVGVGTATGCRMAAAGRETGRRSHGTSSFWFQLRRSLLFGSFHLKTLVGTVPVKQFVPIGSSVGSLRDASKTIEIQLPLEGRQLSVPEIPRQHILHESICVPHRKCISPR